jgi:hypothetical protein
MVTVMHKAGLFHLTHLRRRDVDPA